MVEKAGDGFILKPEDDFNGVSEDGAACVRLRHTGLLSYPEIAARLSLPMGTVRSRLHRARQQILKNRAMHAAKTASQQQLEGADD